MNPIVNKICVNLCLDIETYQNSELMYNQYVKPGSQLKSLKLNDFSLASEHDEWTFVSLTPQQLNQIGYSGSEITLVENRSKYHKGFSHTFKNSNGFTVQELFKALETFEKGARPRSMWLGGIDAHHVCFGGFEKIKGTENSFTVVWDS